MPLIPFVYGLLLLLNALWFGAAFVQFGLRPGAAAKWLVSSPSMQDSALFRTLAASVRFLGGMNLALALFALVLLLTRSLFPESAQCAVFTGVFAVAHGSQFAFNVPVARRDNRYDEALWSVRRGPMRFIFGIDAALAVANALVCVAFLSA